MEYSKRIDQDAFYTSLSTARKIMRYVIGKYPELKKRQWHEPAAGSGNFLQAATEVDIHATAGDINPQIDHNKFWVDKEDFLETNRDLTGQVVFGNPPYGKRNKLTKAFINKSFKLGAEYVIFLVFGSMAMVSNLKSIKGGECIHVKRVKAEFESPGIDIKKVNKPIQNMSPIIMVFKRKPIKIDYSSYTRKPYIKISNKIEYNYLHSYSYSGKKSEWKYNSKELIKGLQKYSYISSKEKRKEMMSMYNYKMTEEDIEFIDKARLLNGINRTMTPASINYWLVHRDRIDLTIL